MGATRFVQQCGSHGRTSNWRPHAAASSNKTQGAMAITLSSRASKNADMAAPSSRFFHPDRSCSRQAASKATANSTVAKTTSAASTPELITIGPTTGGDSKTASRTHDAHSDRGPNLATASQTADASKTASVRKVAASSAGFDTHRASAAVIRNGAGESRWSDAGRRNWQSPSGKIHRRLQVVEGVVGKEVNQPVSRRPTRRRPRAAASKSPRQSPDRAELLMAATIHL